MTRTSGKILIIDDNEDLLLAARLFLKKHFAVISTEKNPKNIPALMANETYDVILLDMNFVRDVTSGEEGFQWLEKILDIDPSAKVIVASGYSNDPIIADYTSYGFAGCVSKPFRMKELTDALRKLSDAL